jgi:Zn-dependent peptidase ImmA (M78 family)
MKLERDAAGIPVLSVDDVERIAEYFLARVAPATLSAPQFTPLSSIVDRVRRSGKCTFSFDEDLGSTSEGYKYLGYYSIRRRHIAIDISLIDDDVRFPFTLAHELGHFFLHGKVKPEALRADSDDGLRDSTRDLTTHRIEASNPRSLMEWQANRFAAAILIPRATVRDALIEHQQSRSINRNLGIVWADRQPKSGMEMRLAVQQLAAVYRVSNSVVRYRLRDLSILQIDHKSMPTRVRDSLGDVLGEMFGQASH